MVDSMQITEQEQYSILNELVAIAEGRQTGDLQSRTVTGGRLFDGEGLKPGQKNAYQILFKDEIESIDNRYLEYNQKFGAEAARYFAYKTVLDRLLQYGILEASPGDKTHSHYQLTPAAKTAFANIGKGEPNFNIDHEIKHSFFKGYEFHISDKIMPAAAAQSNIIGKAPIEESPYLEYLNICSVSDADLIVNKKKQTLKVSLTSASMCAEALNSLLESLDAPPPIVEGKINLTIPLQKECKQLNSFINACLLHQNLTSGLNSNEQVSQQATEWLYKFEQKFLQHHKDEIYRFSPACDHAIAEINASVAKHYGITFPRSIKDKIDQPQSHALDKHREKKIAVFEKLYKEIAAQRDAVSGSHHTSDIGVLRILEAKNKIAKAVIEAQSNPVIKEHQGDGLWTKIKNAFASIISFFRPDRAKTVEHVGDIFNEKAGMKLGG